MDGQFTPKVALQFDGGILPDEVPIPAAPGQRVFTSSGSFVVPDGVESISAVCVGAGQDATASRSGDGGDLRWISSIAVTPGETLSIVVPGQGATTSAQIKRGATILLQAASGAGGTSSTTGGTIGGGNGGVGQSRYDHSEGYALHGGGGGAGGYTGNGGRGGVFTTNPTAGSGGAGGGGTSGNGNLNANGGGGGGVGLAGQGTSGASGGNGYGGGGGKGGSGGADGISGASNGVGHGGAYGGGGGGPAGKGAQGAVRIIWGDGRAYPSTNTADV